MNFRSYANKTRFQMKSCAPGLANLLDSTASKWGDGVALVNQSERTIVRIREFSKKTCGLSNSGPYKLQLICEALDSWAKGILNIFLFSNLPKIHIARMKSRKNFKPNRNW